VEGQPYPASIDPKLFAHVISNLLSNAFKYSQDRPAPHLHISFEPKQTIVKIQDRGIGIPEKEIASLFDSFYRAQNVDNIQGTGLGLSIVKQFVEMHGANISVKSTIDEGSVFSIELPRNADN
jgi:signal transduction histidine kinase